MAAKLYSTTVGEGPPVLLLHGLFGMGSNLGALARSLRGDYQVHSIDLPNHGRSDWQSDTDIASQAEALSHWMDEQSLTQASILGHSLGGKVAMELALNKPERVAALVVADIAPVQYTPRHDAVFAGLLAVAEARCESRAQARKLMAQHLPEPELLEFLLLSLQRGDDGRFDWRFNLAALHRGYASVIAALDSIGPYEGPALFIKGGDSDYILERHRIAITQRFPGVQVKVMAGCGHWLHAQQPALFNRIVGRFLAEQSV